MGLQFENLVVNNAMTAYVVEVKRKNLIDPSVEEEMRTKISRLPVRPGVNVRPVLVYTGELSKTVEADGCFDAVVPIRKLLEAHS